MPIPLDDDVRRLLDGKNFATVATLTADGSPHTSVVWYRRDGDSLVFSTKVNRVKARNLERDPRVSVSVFDLANPYTAVDIRGTAELTLDEPKTLPQELSQRYLGQDPPPEPDEDKRYIVRVWPERVSRFGG